MKDTIDALVVIIVHTLVKMPYNIAKHLPRRAVCLTGCDDCFTNTSLYSQYLVHHTLSISMISIIICVRKR